MLFHVPKLIEDNCGQTGKMKHMQKIHGLFFFKELDQLKNFIRSIRTPTSYGSSSDKDLKLMDISHDLKYMILIIL